MSKRTARILGLTLSILALGGCTMDLESPDGIDDVGVVAGGKADGSDYSECELAQVAAWLNEGPDVDTLENAGVHSRAATNLVRHRDGADGAFGTGDDDLFADIAEVDAVSWVGPVAISQLVDAVADRCTVTPPTASEEVIFSPQDYETSHLARVAGLIDGAETSIDIAMYSFSDRGIQDALQRAVSRGVTIRMIFETASSDRSSPAGTASARLEDMGIEVRWINKIMHHKFAIIDGARTDLAAAANATLVTGSGNWSNSAGTRYDENTLFFHGNVELALRYQREFNHLWDNGRLFVHNESIPALEAIAIAESDIPDDPTVDAVFTSANFNVTQSARYGATFSVVRGQNTVADRWVDLISHAQRSIRIASGHLRSRPIAEALIAAHEANPDLDIRVYLDGQEYLAASTHAIQESDLATCLDAAGTSVARREDCLDSGFLFSYQVHEAGIALRYKYYAYRWDYSYAVQMHDKLMIVDDETVITGSYNLSDNAEHATMENDVIFTGPTHRALVDAYIDAFDQMWVTGEADGLYRALTDQIVEATGDFPIVFDAMALDWDQVTELKRVIRDNCPDINSTDYRTNAAAHRYCNR